MRNILLSGATAVVVAFGSADAFAMGGRDLSPEQSPYALLGPQAIPEAPMSEGRSAYTDSEQQRPRSHHFKHRLAHPEDQAAGAPGR
jgi:hypothetical protein